MKYLLMAIRDRASKVYDRPVPTRSEPEAIRMLADIAKDESTMIGQHPDDFTMFHIGYYDDATGTITPEDAPAKVATASEALGMYGKQVVPINKEVTN